MKSYITPIEKDEEGNLLLTFPDELMETMDWKEGEVLEWIDNQDGSWTLKKMPWSVW